MFFSTDTDSILRDSNDIIRELTRERDSIFTTALERQHIEKKLHHAKVIQRHARKLDDLMKIN